MIFPLVFTCLAGALLGLSFIEPRLGALSFITFIPLFHICFRCSYLKSYGYALAMGVSAFAVANYWVYFFLDNLLSSTAKTLALFTCYVLYSAQTLCILVIGAKWLNVYLPIWLAWLVTPLFGCCVFYFYPLIFEFNLGVTQVGFPGILQPISQLSHWSLSALILAINLILADKWIFQPKNFVQRLKHPVSVASLLLVVWLIFGSVSRWQMGHNAKLTQLTIGFHQLNDPIGMNMGAVRPGFTRTFTRELENSYTLAEAGASLIVWPESHAKDILNKPWVLDAYREHAKTLNANLMLQELTRVNRRPAEYSNASIFISPSKPYQVHKKNKRIPFGEHLPEVLDQGELGVWLREVFADVLKQIQAGERATVFQHKGIYILPQICYEFLDGHYVNNAMRQNPEVQLIIAQSNDSWFSSRRQVLMHNAFAILRAVENRRPLLHVINAGPSYAINEYGEITQQSEYLQSGGYITEVQLNEHSKHHHMLVTPKQFIQVASAVSILAFLFSAYRYFRRRRQGNKTRLNGAKTCTRGRTSPGAVDKTLHVRR